MWNLVGVREVQLTAKDLIYGHGIVYKAKDIDPLAMGKILWPHVKFYKQQKDIIYSVWYNDETYVPAGNKLGKDFLAGFVVVVYFLTRHPCRIITTSAKDEHLRVLWGEIGQFIQTCVSPLSSKVGGPLVLTHHEMRKIVNRQQCPKSYTKGMVAGPDSIAAMQGHHIANIGDGIPRTLFVSDESSSVPDEYWTMARTWANRALVIGNPWPCSNFFYRAVRGTPGTDDHGGDLPRDPTNYAKGYYRRVIKIRAEDSPNIRLAMAQIAKGMEPTNEILLPGVKDYEEYKKNRLMWDEIQQTVSLDGEFFEGKSQRMYPQAWLEASHQLADRWGPFHPTGKGLRKTRAIGIDPAAGGDKTAFAAIDEHGIIELQSAKTPDTNVIVNEILAFQKRHNVPWSRVCIDIGGGGKQHADRLKAKGHAIRVVAFGDTVSDDPKDYNDSVRSEDIQLRRTVYKNRRAEMYGTLRDLIDPALVSLPPLERSEAFKALQGQSGELIKDFYGFSIPRVMTVLTRQMLPIPLTYDGEGRFYVIPKHKRHPKDEQPNLTSLLGGSPDELDAVVLAVHAMLRPEPKPRFMVV